MIRDSKDTIAAVATAPGRGGIGIVRVSGSKLDEFAETLTGRQLVPRVATLATFRDATGAVIDEGIVILFRGPSSYTGEDVVELQGHGGQVITNMVLRRCVELGARLAEPGEFTYRAYLNDKLDLAQAESVADVIEATTETAARSAMRSLQGEFSSRVHLLVGALIELRMLVEATLDFPEEEIGAEHHMRAVDRLPELKAMLLQVLESSRQGSILRNGLQVVLAGQPNVGKSSLMNCLTGENLAIVTAIPGTTRDTVRQGIHIDGVPIHVIDTAGLRTPADEVEAIGIERTWDAISKADLMLLIVDSREGVTDLDRSIAEKLSSGLKVLTVYNKSDLLEEGLPPHTPEGSHPLLVSAKSGDGIEGLKKAILDHAGWHPGSEGTWMARERQILALSRAMNYLERAESVVSHLELFAEELRLAQEALGEITGEFLADDLLGEIFSRFCIGK